MRAILAKLNQPLRAWHGILLAIIAVTGYAAASSLYVGSLILPTSSDSLSTSTGAQMNLTSKSGSATPYNFVLTEPSGCGSSGIMSIGGTLGLFSCEGGYTTATGTITAALFSSAAFSASETLCTNSSKQIISCLLPVGAVTDVTASSPLQSSGGTTPNISFVTNPTITGQVTLSGSSLLVDGTATFTGSFVKVNSEILSFSTFEFCPDNSCTNNVTIDTIGNLILAAGNIDVVAGSIEAPTGSVTAGTQVISTQNVIFGDASASHVTTLGSGQDGAGCGITDVNGFSLRSLSPAPSPAPLLVGNLAGDVGSCGKMFANDGNAVPNAFSSNALMTTGSCPNNSACGLNSTPSCNGTGEVCFFAVFLTGNNNGGVMALNGTDGSGHVQLVGIWNASGGTISAGTSVGYTRYDT